MGSIAVFPTSRNRTRIRRTAAFMATVPPNHAEGHLREQLRRLGQGLRKRGVPEELVVAEVQAYEAALRVAYWQVVILQDGGAA